MRREQATKDRGPKYWVGEFLLLLISMVLPSMAVMKATDVFGVKTVAIYLSSISLVTALAYSSDKQKARKQLWRIPESTLHFLELIGGWASGFLSQRLFRHKISKRAYQVSFWMIAIIHNYASFDYLKDWHYTKLFYHSVKAFLQQALA